MGGGGGWRRGAVSGGGGAGGGGRWPRVPDDGDFVDHVVVGDGGLGLLV